MTSNELNASAFEKALAAWGDKVDTIAADLQRAASIDAFGRIIEKSPVHFFKGGSFKGRWLVGLNVSPSGGSDSPDPSGSKARARAKAALGLLKPYGLVFITNNSPQARTLEFGGYPKSVKYGTFVPLSHAKKISANARILARRKGRGKAITRGKNKGKRRGEGEPLRVQLSEGGYSRQAPKGIVRVTIQEVVAAWNQIAEAVLRRNRAR